MLSFKKIFVLIVMACAFVHASAQSMRQIWMDMPDEIAPYLNRSNRTELADYVEMKVDAAIRNKLGDTTRVEMLTADYLRVALNASSRMEMKLLKQSDGTPLICVIRTFLGSAADSRMAFYDIQWQPVTSVSMPTVSAEQMFTHPEGMTDERFSELRAMLDPMLTQMQLQADSNLLTLNYSIPTVSCDDIKELRSILRTVTLEWNGKEFSTDLQ